MTDQKPSPAPGDRIVVHTPDRRAYFGHLLELRQRAGTVEAIVRLDTGWVTAYPMYMLEPVPDRAPGQDGSSG